MNRQELIDRAREIVNQDVVKGFTADFLKMAANDLVNPARFETYLKNISEQAWDPRTEENTIATYSQELVDIVKELFPKTPDYPYLTENRLIDIAKKHVGEDSDDKTKVQKMYELLDDELSVGINVETEHTKSKKKAEKIALDHLEEIPDYYTRLKKMEKGALKSKIKNKLRESLFLSEVREHTNEEIVDFNEIDLQYEYNKLNDLLFDGKLQPVTMLWNKRKGAHGVVKGSRNRATGKITLKSLSMSQFLKVPYKFFKDVLAHEMIHVFWMQQDVNAKHGPLFVQQMNRINSMGLGFNVSVRSDSSETSKFEMSADVVKQGMELVFSLIETDKEKNMFSVMKYDAYKEQGYRIANIYNFLVNKKPKYRFATGEFFLSTNPKLQASKIQRSFGSISYTIIDDAIANDLKKDAKFLSKFEVDKSPDGPDWSGPDKPNPESGKSLIGF
jgi:hypothetical protein